METQNSSEISEFYFLTNFVNKSERKLAEIQENLSISYDTLVNTCPHPEAVDRPSGSTGVARRCKVCGITDYASEGGTPGDEYNYGYAGHPNKSFWSGTKIVSTTEEEFNNSRRHHDWVVTDGKPRKRFS